MMNRYFVVARGSTCPRGDHAADSFEEMRRRNYERDDREREAWQFHRAGERAAARPTWDRTRRVDPAE